MLSVVGGQTPGRFAFPDRLWHPRRQFSVSHGSTLHMKKYLVTGGAGFIGSRLAKKLTAHGQVTVLDNLLPQVHAGNPDNVDRVRSCGATLIEADIRDREALAAALNEAKPDVIYHLAAETGTGQSFDLPVRYNDVNVMGTANLIEAVRSAVPDLERIVLASSRSVYGEGAYVNDAGQQVLASERRAEDMEAGDFSVKCHANQPLSPIPTNAACPVAPASIYASTKLMQEYLLHQAFWGTRTQIGLLRLQNVYGAGQSLNNPYTGVLSIFCRQIEEDRTLNIYEDGEIIRDFVHVDDVVSAFEMMGTIDTMPDGIIDIGSGEATSILVVARLLLDLLDKPGDRYTITGAFRPGDIRYAVADISRATDELGWRPQIPLADGLSHLITWSRSELQNAMASS